MPRSAGTRRRRRGRIRAVQLEQSVGAVKLVLFVVIVAPTDSVFETFDLNFVQTQCNKTPVKVNLK